MKGFLKAVLLVGLAVAGAGIQALVSPAARSVLVGEPRRSDTLRAVDAEDATIPTLWIDARAQEDFKAGHIPGAFLLNGDNWESGIAPVLMRWTEGLRVVVYCGGADCDRSRRVADRLRQNYQIGPVYVLEGGFPAWKGRVEK